MSVRIPKHRVPTHPGEMLVEEYLKPLGMTQAAAAKLLDISRNRLNEIIMARRGVTPDTALRLERVFGASAQSWLNLQLAWDLYHVEHGPAARAIRGLKRAAGLPEFDEALAAVG